MHCFTTLCMEHNKLFKIKSYKVIYYLSPNDFIHHISILRIKLVIIVKQYGKLETKTEDLQANERRNE